MNTMTYTCPRCQSPVESGAGFCPSCGAQMAPMNQPGMQPMYQSGQPMYQAMYQSNAGYMPRYAGFWIRVVAYIIDALVLLIPNLIVQYILRGAPALNYLVELAIDYAYFGYFWTTTGQSVGMKALNLRVQRTDGGAITWGAALGRLVMIWVSCIPIFLGLIWVAFQPEKRGWHDLACNTVVTYTN